MIEHNCKQLKRLLINLMLQLTGRHIRLHNSTSDEDLQRLFKCQEFVAEFVTIKNKAAITQNQEQLKLIAL